MRESRPGVAPPAEDPADEVGATPGRDSLEFGAGTRIRTRDLLITNQLLYQLSYTGITRTVF